MGERTDRRWLLLGGVWICSFLALGMVIMSGSQVWSALVFVIAGTIFAGLFVWSSFRNRSAGELEGLPLSNKVAAGAFILGPVVVILGVVSQEDWVSWVGAGVFICGVLTALLSGLAGWLRDRTTRT